MAKAISKTMFGDGNDPILERRAFQFSKCTGASRRSSMSSFLSPTHHAIQFFKMLSINRQDPSGTFGIFCLSALTSSLTDSCVVRRMRDQKCITCVKLIEKHARNYKHHQTRFMYVYTCGYIHAPISS